MVVTIALTIGFGKSDNLAAAYGIAVSATMLMSSALLPIAMREIWQWSHPASIAVAGIFFVIDAAFFVFNSLKISEGGYVPLLLAGAVYTMMFIWQRGADAITERIHETLIPLDTFMGDVLVVDTVGIRSLRPFAMVDIYGTPYTDSLHVLERYRLIDREGRDRSACAYRNNGSGLIIDASVSSPCHGRRP
jgi:K+ transporter